MSDPEQEEELRELEEELAEDHPVDCTCIYCIPGA